MNVAGHLSRYKSPALARLDEFTMAHGRKVVIDPCQDPIGLAQARWRAEPARAEIGRVRAVALPIPHIPIPTPMPAP